MNFSRWMVCCAILATIAGRGDAAVTFTTTHAAGAHDLDGVMSNSDALQGLIAWELIGDRGWHSANPASLDSLNPNGLPAFTDGVGAIGGQTGLLNDFPPVGLPTKLLQFDLAAPTTIQTINIFTGNVSNADGRIFSTTVIRYSTDGGANFTDLGYFQSDLSGSINDESDLPGTSRNHVTQVSIFDDATAALAAGVTNLQFDFYAVDNTQGQLRDPFDGENPFTGVDDQLTAAFVSPLVWEIDVLGPAGVADIADFDGDGDIDGSDFVTWQRGLGLNGTATRLQGDADGDQNVTAADLAIWKEQFGPSMLAAVPEPAAGTGMILGWFACCRADASRRRQSASQHAWRHR